ncbi:MAG: prepilin-type N-terminal cleavage/methylation domain-containing protein [Actinomycetota bacterium]|nr:prepilin-type N-terminal cleavage/methylation domain-containing protein [Actinomycetota bacterium]
MNSASNLRRNLSGSPRRGFTLVELLVVFVVLALLIALLLPAINGAVRSARNAAVSSEISQIAQGLAQFKSAHNVYPPSRIILSESGNYSPAFLRSNNTRLNAMTVADVTALANRSVSYLRRVWPKMVLNTSGAVAATVPGGFYDFNGDGSLGDPAQVHVLDGAECLVFFLGGLPGNVGSNQMTVTGFSQNPANPAISELNTTLGANRTSPMYEFRGGRLVDNYPKRSTGVSGNGFPEYLDGLGGADAQPFAYFSSYEGAGYDPDDVDYAEEGALATGALVAASWTAQGAVATGIAGKFFNLSSPDYSPAPNPYTNGPSLKSSTTPNPEYVNKSTFQIISAGFDGQFGIGGAFQTTGTDVLPFASAYGQPANLATSIRERERDNLTNFKGGRLD